MKNIFFCFLFLGTSSFILAQSISPFTINATGGSNIVGSSYLDWSVGEMCLVQTYTAGSYTITQGLLQPYQQIPNQIEFIDEWQAKIYPNPTTGLLILEANIKQAGTIKATILDALGKLVFVQEEQVPNGNWEQTYDLEKQASGIYFFQLEYLDSNLHQQKLVFKIQKQN